jgi:peptidoglycan/LPS O-acetylase OafA/YrhL
MFADGPGPAHPTPSRSIDPDPSADRKHSMAHYRQLDGVRAVAVALVFVNHLWLPQTLLGQLGVRLFFVLSGFLITSILLEARARSAPLSGALTTFYARRALRIFPLYYVALAVLVLVDAPEVRRYLPWHALYGTNLLIARTGEFTNHSTDHFWSLAVEEQFYFVWPFVILLVPRRLLRPTLVSLIAGGVLFRVGGRLIFDWGFTPTLVLLFGCVDALGLGALLALEGDAIRDKVSRIGMIFCPVLALVLVAQAAGQGTKLTYVFFEFSAAACSAALVRGAVRGFPGVVGRWLTHPAVAYTGTISYGLYVWHMPIRALVTQNPFGVIVLSVAAATFTWYAFERPLSGLKRYFTYDQATAARGMRLVEGRPAFSRI